MLRITLALLLFLASASPSWAQYDGAPGSRPHASNPHIAPRALGLVQTITLTSSATTVIFDNIPQGGTDLRLVIRARSNSATTVVGNTVTFNGDTGANYDYFHDTFNSAGVFAAQNFGQTSLIWYWVTAATGCANASSAIEVRIFGYTSTAFNKAYHYDSQGCPAASAGNFARGVGTGQWRSLAPLTQIKIVEGNGGSYIAGSTFTLWVS